MLFPSYRPRRLRKTKSIRKIIQETDLSVSDFIYPMFVIPGNGVKEEITPMPGIFRYSIDNTIKEIKEINEHGSEGYNENGIIQKALRKIKEEIKDILLITDVCLCEYTSHGHCGIVKDGEVENDETLQYLGRMALSHAKAGADIVAPSDMMDGRVGVIREVLDENGFQNVAIMSYSAKYASAFYGPFREAEAYFAE